MVRLTVPTIACVIGEGGSGGAVAIAVSDRVLMQENAIYSVITPEGCAAILWRDAGEAKKAAAAFKPDALHCLELGVIDGIVAEPVGGAHSDHDEAARLLRAALVESLEELEDTPGEELRRHRRAKFRGHGRLCVTFATQSRDFPHHPQGFQRARTPSETRRGPPSSGPRAPNPPSGTRSQARSFPSGAELNLPLVENDTPSSEREAARKRKASPVSLSEYRRKRDPKKTGEPFPAGAEPSSQQPIFVVQRHDARALHYDFRLERNGALASWAVPKGVPLEPGGRALAVHVEDHPLEYASFHGEIPRGQYGAGTVELWDSGTYELLEEKPDGRLTVELHGSRLRGRWSLVPAHLDGKEQNWLLIKGHDEEERAIPDASIGRCSPRSPRCSRAAKTGRFEVKFDGYRALAYVRGGDCTLLSRNDNDLTARFSEVAKAIAKAVKSPNAVVDGEVARIDASGRTSFSELQQGTGALVFYAFDLLELDGESKVDLPLRERKRQLRELLDARVKNVAYSKSFDDGDALFEAAKERGLEGVVAERLDSVYRERRPATG